MVNVSFLITNFNGGKIVLHTLKSIYSSTRLKDFEVVLVDDCSTDNSVNLIKKEFPKVRIFVNKKNSGPAYTRNRCIKESKGRYLLFVDNDARLGKDCYNKLIKAIMDYDIVFPTTIYDNGLIMYPTLKNEKDYIKVSVVFMVKKGSLNKLDKLFDENHIFYDEDLDFFFRCKLFGLKSKYIEDAKAYHVVKELKEFGNLSNKYYLKFRTTIYSNIKLGPFSKLRKGSFELTPLWKLMMMAVFNLNLLYVDHLKSYRENKTFLDKLRFVVYKNSKLSGNYFIPWVYFFKAILWGIYNLDIALKERRRLLKFYKRFL